MEALGRSATRLNAAAACMVITAWFWIVMVRFKQRYCIGVSHACPLATTWSFVFETRNDDEVKRASQGTST